MLCCGYILTDFPISIRLTSLTLWQSNDCPSASKATLMNMDKYFMWIHYERLRNHNIAKHNKTVCIFLGIYCKFSFHMLDDEWWNAEGYGFNRSLSDQSKTQHITTGMRFVGYTLNSLFHEKLAANVIWTSPTILSRNCAKCFLA